MTANSGRGMKRKLALRSACPPVTRYGRKMATSSIMMIIALKAMIRYLNFNENTSIIKDSSYISSYALNIEESAFCVNAEEIAEGMDE